MEGTQAELELEQTCIRLSWHCPSITAHRPQPIWPDIPSLISPAGNRRCELFTRDPIWLSCSPQPAAFEASDASLRVYLGAMADDLLELMKFSDTKIEANATKHRVYQPGLQTWQHEIWTRDGYDELGRGSYGVVWREEEGQTKSECFFVEYAAVPDAEARMCQKCELSNKFEKVVI
nr:hypothetical protein CFP56_36398 [Quercus suber]